MDHAQYRLGCNAEMAQFKGEGKGEDLGTERPRKVRDNRTGE